MTGTPFGDTADILLSDTPTWLLNRYPAVVLFSQLEGMMEEVKAKLTEYVAGGGILVVTADALSGLPGSLLGVRVSATNKTLPFGAVVSVTNQDGSATKVSVYSVSVVSV